MQGSSGEMLAGDATHSRPQGTLDLSRRASHDLEAGAGPLVKSPSLVPLAKSISGSMASDGLVMRSHRGSTANSRSASPVEPDPWPRRINTVPLDVKVVPSMKGLRPD